jgi:methylated-DNA-[protein]-cysteine S-methyltransferase
MISLYIRNIDGVWFGTACDEREIFATTFAFDEKRAMQGLLESIPFDVPFQELEKTSGFADRVIAVLKDIYEGNDASLSLSLATRHLPQYTRRVIDAARLIPTGYVASYGSIAKAVGGGPRAVGNVMAKNPFPPLVPCHRVVRSDLTLGGYGGGLDVKADILKGEKRGYTSKREVTVKGKDLQVFPVEFVLRKLGRISK